MLFRFSLYYHLAVKVTLEFDDGVISFRIFTSFLTRVTGHFCGCAEIDLLTKLQLPLLLQAKRNI